MTSDAEMGKRLLEAMSGRPQKWLAEQLGVAPSTVQGYTKGKMPPADVALAICDILNIDIAWYINGTSATGSGSDHLVYVPVLNHPDGSGATLPYAASLIGHFGVPIDSLVCLIASGGLMHPTVPKGAEMLITRETGDIDDGGIYAIRSGDREIVRRIRVRVDGGMEAVCDNPAAHGDRADEVDPSAVTGKLIWISCAV